ncbi:MAG: GDP-L-fucose synthase [Bacteroidales bacterium]|jgi:GDP-L-fucose synthase|nr:GDP-L-fucose synthase [Bacteroidales bacterium]
MIDRRAKIYIAGHKGLVGSAILKNLEAKGFSNFVLRTKEELDLTDQNAVADFFSSEKPEYVILAAAKVGGIVANNTYRAQFIYENLMIQNHIIHQSYLNQVKKLVFLGSTCIYPREAVQPIEETELLTGPLEYTNEPYAIAKIAGIKMCESYNIQYGTNFISIMPTNLYGPNDNFNLETSHVLPAILRKIYLGRCIEKGDWDAVFLDLQKRPIEQVDHLSDKESILKILEKYGIAQKDGKVRIEMWGSGNPKREFLWSEEMADATTFIMEKVSFSDVVAGINPKEIRNTHINIGTGEEISIKDLAFLVKKEIGFEGELWFNTQKPDGTMRKLTDVKKLHSLGWKHKIQIEEGVKRLFNWYVNE